MTKESIFRDLWNIYIKELESFLGIFDEEDEKLAMNVNIAITDLKKTAGNRTSAKRCLKRYIKENQMKVGPEHTERLAIFNKMKETCNDALVVLDNLTNLHKHKNMLRIATRMFNEATAVKPQVDEDQVEFLTF